MEKLLIKIIEDIHAEISEDLPKLESTRLGRKNEFPLVLLASLPGSGNTWCRVLLEDSTGIYTGSPYSDENLIQGGFVGEAVPYLSGRTLGVKTHRMREVKASAAVATILIIRNPFDAAKAEWTRLKTRGKTNSHTGVASEEIFKGEAWEAHARKSLNWFSELIFNTFSQMAKNHAKVHVVYYEDLKRNSTLEMEMILHFLMSEVQFKPDNAFARLENIKRMNEKNEKFHRPKVEPTFEYFNDELIELGNNKTELIFQFMQQLGFLSFKKEEYMKGNTTNIIISENEKNAVKIKAEMYKKSSN